MIMLFYQHPSYNWRVPPKSNVYKLQKQFQKNYVAIGLCSNWKSNTILQHVHGSKYIYKYYILTTSSLILLSLKLCNHLVLIWIALNLNLHVLDIIQPFSFYSDMHCLDSKYTRKYWLLFEQTVLIDKLTSPTGKPKATGGVPAFICWRLRWGIYQKWN